MKPQTTDTETPQNQPTEIDPNELVTATGGYTTTGVDSPEYQSWYFSQGPGAVKR
jgi:hypothetical protein